METPDCRPCPPDYVFDEAFFGGRERNKHWLRENWKAGKTPVVGARDDTSGMIIAKVVEDTTREILFDFVNDLTHRGRLRCTARSVDGSGVA